MVSCWKFCCRSLSDGLKQTPQEHVVNHGSLTKHSLSEGSLNGVFLWLNGCLGQSVKKVLIELSSVFYVHTRNYTSVHVMPGPSTSSIMIS